MFTSPLGFGGGPKFFFFGVPLGGVFRVFGGGLKFFFFRFFWEGCLD